ncbi:L,D-transpeptidase [Terrimonas sp. NA20]|uniref:L,D-transpeptidase n=1 Tax=Terrimonas ginsenosidimutans TaxID=2908004 RepID=A0ABS9KLI3_9BACT|nr:L,D-transpeptidase [Terrimonas ginsenosidimutans]MCG2613182.1 L,D-transpeptidase [Terrimonas ginsenosidimutans]
MKLIRISSVILVTLLFFTQCREPEQKEAVPEEKKVQRPPAPQWKKPSQEISYQKVAAKQWFRKQKDSLNAQQQKIVMTANRADLANISALDSVLLPNDLSGDIVFYQPFPLEVKGLQDISKIIFFSYPSQTFGAYEYGNLVYAGATNMGRKKDPTPAGLYFTNWKAEKTTSTFNDEWELKWNFNIENKEGIGWHQYAMPGYPASHSCLRLFEDDAQYLYKWADEWKLKGTDSVVLKGTPVIVFGDYPFDGPKPWLSLVSDAHALDIKAAALEGLIGQHQGEIMEAQKKREGMK